MSGGPDRWKRLAVRLVQHAACVMPPASSAWAAAMLREVEHIEGGVDVLLWAFGCLIAGYRSRLATARCFNSRKGFERCVTYATVMGLVCVGALSSAAGQIGRVQPVFQQSACDLPGLSPDLAPRVRCGTVNVPRSYAQPSLGVFRLAVVVVKSAQQPALPDPVVYISGGPGSPLTMHADYQAHHPYAPGRDLVLVTNAALDVRSQACARASPANFWAPTSRWRML